MTGHERKSKSYENEFTIANMVDYIHHSMISSSYFHEGQQAELQNELGFT